MLGMHIDGLGFINHLGALRKIEQNVCHFVEQLVFDV